MKLQLSPLALAVTMCVHGVIIINAIRSIDPVQTWCVCCNDNSGIPRVLTFAYIVECCTPMCVSLMTCAGDKDYICTNFISPCQKINGIKNLSGAA